MTRTLLAAVSLLALTGGPATAADPLAGKKPNIVFILTDDQGYGDISAHGNPVLTTPNLDRLHAEGVRFTDFHVSPTCSPTRSALLTGRHEFKNGVTHTIHERERLTLDAVTLPQVLKTAGYTTGIFGKWHLGGKDGAAPGEQGFDAVFDSQGEGNKKGEPDDPKGVFSLTDKACAFINANAKKPFFCYVPHHGIHTPLQARPESLKRFQAKKPGQQHKNAMYAACLYDLDAAVGKLLAKLRELKLEDDTLVIFTSDNGGTQQSSQEPLRGNKGCYYEGGIREPFIAYWPKVIAAGSTCDVPVHNTDLFPTFLDLAGATTTAKLDGESLAPLFKGGKELKRSAIFWHFPGYLDNPVIRGRDPVFRSRPVSVIRKGDFKLHLYHEEWQLDGGREKIAANNAVELYDLKADVGETKNVAATDAKKRDELLDDLLKWLTDTKAPLATKPNPAYTGKEKK